MSSQRNTLLAPPTAPLEVVRAFVDARFVDGVLTLHYWRGGWQRYTGTHWETCSDREIRTQLYNFTDNASYRNGKGEQVPWSPNQRRVSDLMDALKAICEIPDAANMPCWLDGRTTGTIVPFRNGLLDLKKRELLPHTPLFFSPMSLSFDYDPEAECHEWDRFMIDLFDDDDEPKMALEQMIGCAVAGKLDLQRIGVLVGPPRSGKGIIASIIIALLGATRVASPRMIGLTDDKTLSSLIGKPACIIADARATTRKMPEIAEALLSISGQDAFTIDRKYLEPWTGRLDTFVFIMSNEFPAIRDASGALPARYLPILMTKSWQGREDRTLRDRLMAELPGIMRRALDGLEEIEASGRFTEPKASVEAAAEMAEMASPMQRFVDEMLSVMPVGGDNRDYVVHVSTLHNAYNTWAITNNESVLDRARFGQRLRAVLPNLRRSQPRDADGKQTTAYTGVRLRSDETSATLALANANKRWGGGGRRRAG